MENTNHILHFPLQYDHKIQINHKNTQKSQQLILNWPRVLNTHQIILTIDFQILKQS